MNRSRIGLGVIAVATAGILALAGCSQGAGDAGGSGGGDTSAIITTNGSEPQSALIPTMVNEVGGGKILDAMFAGLVYYDAKGAPHNDIATSIESNDAINYTIKIRDDAKFTDGTTVKAKNFVDAWNYGAALDNAQLNSYFFEDIEGFSYDENVPELSGLKVVDDTTFTVTLNKAASDFPLRLGYSAYFPLPDSAWDDLEAYGQAPIGNGPYKIGEGDAWKHNEEIALVKNDDYNGPREVKNGGLTIKFYVSLDAAYSDILSGNLRVRPGRPCGQPARRDLPVLHHPGAPRALRRRRGQAAPSGHLDGHQPRRDHRRYLRGHSYPRKRLHLTRHRRLERFTQGRRGARFQP